MEADTVSAACVHKARIQRQEEGRRRIQTLFEAHTHELANTNTSDSHETDVHNDAITLPSTAETLAAAGAVSGEGAAVISPQEAKEGAAEVNVEGESGSEWHVQVEQEIAELAAKLRAAKITRHAMLSKAEALFSNQTSNFKVGMRM